MKTDQSFSLRFKKDGMKSAILKISFSTGLTRNDIIEAMCISKIDEGPDAVIKALKSRIDSGKITVHGSGELNWEDIKNAINEVGAE